MFISNYGTVCPQSLPFINFEQHNVRALGKPANRRGKVDMLIVHHKSKDSTSSPATKTLKSLPGWIHIKGGTFFLMERTESPEICSLPLKRKIIANDIHDVGGIGDLLDTFYGYSRHLMKHCSVGSHFPRNGLSPLFVLGEIV